MYISGSGGNIQVGYGGYIGGEVPPVSNLLLRGGYIIVEFVSSGTYTGS